MISIGVGRMTEGCNTLRLMFVDLCRFSSIGYVCFGGENFDLGMKMHAFRMIDMMVK